MMSSAEWILAYLEENEEPTKLIDKFYEEVEESERTRKEMYDIGIRKL